MINEIWELSFCTKYKYLNDYLELLAEFSDTIGANEKENYPHVEPEDEDLWMVTLYFKEKPDYEDLKERIFIFSKHINDEIIDEINLVSTNNQDWTKMLEDNFKPIEIDEFFVYNPNHHTFADKHKLAIAIGYFQAFGTGEHETTKACLKALLKLKEKENFNNILDLGTGSAILAIASRKLWAESNILASDIDENAVEIAKLNIELNQIDNIKCIDENGVGDNIQKLAPFNLVIANILANPLIDMSEEIANITISNSYLVLSGFLTWQAEKVILTYNKYGFNLISQIQEGDWVSIILKK